ncbi:MBL fold metallo-hydrolase [bacterium]|nr:MBL fold metallo-hydrolase [bacterium]
MSSNFISFNENLSVFLGAINVGVIRNGWEALLIDFGTGEVLKILGKYGIKKIDGVLFTHHHRDQALGVKEALERGTWIAVPEKERSLFEDVEKYWNDPTKRYHLYYFRQNLLIAEPIKVDSPLRSGEEISWGPAKITALSTPGHTDGSMSFIVEVKDEKIAFCGDLIYDKGKIFDVFSLQKGFGNLTDYHGFMFAWRKVIESLRGLLEMGIKAFVPSHGKIITEPKVAVDLLEERFKKCYENYLSSSALWHYFPRLLSEQSQKGPLASAPLRKTPPFLLHIGTSWLIISDKRRAFILDCGSEDAIKEIEALIQEGKIDKVDGLWITHIHDDHTDAIPLLRQRFSCEVIAEESVAKVVSNPKAWKLPCLSPNPIQIDRIVRNGESWQWEEFKLTAYHFPGQTLYHSGLLVEGKGNRLFFCGDSFTPTGLDDYCAYNRNFLSENEGYDYCLRLLEEIKPKLTFNSHIDTPFSISSQEVALWRRTLKEREKLMGELLPWENPNFGIDPYWAFAYPYELELSPGETGNVKIIIKNHSAQRIKFKIKPRFPQELACANVSQWVERKIEGKEESFILLPFSIPFHISPGQYVVLVDVTRREQEFPALIEFILRIK